MTDYLQSLRGRLGLSPVWTSSSQEIIALIDRLEAAEAVIVAYANETRFDNRWAHRRSQDAEKIWEKTKERV